MATEMVAATFPKVRRAVSPRTVLLISALGVFMAFLDNTVVEIAFPNMLKSFPGSQLSSLSWVFNVYNITLGALLVPTGRLADIVGRRRMFVVGVTLFGLASALCAAAPSVGFLIGARALQGAGAAIVVPTSLALILHGVEQEQRTQSIALWSATGALAAGIGPSIGGALVDAYDWRLVFLINVPISAVVWHLARKRLVESRASGRRALPDLVGALLLAGSIGSLSLAVMQGQSWGWIDPRTALAFVAALVAAALLARRNSRHASPILDVEMLRSRGFAAANALTIVGSAGFFALGLANILYLMRIWGYSPLIAGLAVTPAPFIAAAAATLAGKLVAHRDPRPFIGGGAIFLALGSLLLADRFSIRAHYLTSYLSAAVLLAIGIGVAFPLVSAIAVGNAPGGRYAGATALNSSIRQIGAALGVAILVALIGQPSPAATEGAFHRAWLFAAICFALVAVGSVALGRVAPVAPVEEIAEGLESVRRRGHAADRSRSRPRPRPRPEVVLPLLDAGAAPKTAAELLAEVPMFASLPSATREAVAERTSVVSVAAGEWLFRQGDDADALYVVRTGRLEIVDETPGREPSVLRELRSGSALGELALVSKSQRTASVRVRRDARLLRIGRDEFETILDASPAFSRTLLRTLADWLGNGRTAAVTHGRVPATIAVIALDEVAAATRIEQELAKRLAELATVSYVTRDAVSESADPGLVLSELLDSAEARHRHVLLAGEMAGTGAWVQSCIRQADRVLLVVADPPAPELCATWRLPSGADVVLLGPVDTATKRLLDDIQPRVTYRLRPGPQRSTDIAALARRLAGRAVGLVLSGGGARCFAHIGVIEELRDAGVQIDRIGGTSMGAFIGALLAQDMTPEEIDARCFEEWVRRNPVGDYRLPRTSLIRGQRARAMLERNFPGSIEDLPRGFFSTSVDLISARPVHHRRGRLALAIGASMALPIFVEPVVLDNMLLLDGGLMDNLPSEAMASDGEGPVIAVDVGEPAVRALAPDQQPTVPSLTETIYKVMLLGETEDAYRHSFADLLIRPDFDGVGILEFHMIDHMREAGRRATQAALENAPTAIFA